MAKSLCYYITGHERRHCCCILVSLEFGVSYERLRRAVQEQQLGHEVLLKLHLAALAHQVDVEAQLQDAVHVRELGEHDRERDAAEHQAEELANDEDD